MGVLHNELRRVGRLVDAFREAFALGEEPGIERLAESLTPIVDLWSRPEWAIRHDEVWWFVGFGGAAGGAGTTVKAGPGLEAGDLLSVITHAAITLGVTGTVEIYRGTAALLTAGDRAWERDVRLGRQPRTALRIATDPTNPGTLLTTIRCSGNIPRELPLHYILTGNTLLYFRAPDNATMWLDFLGYERHRLSSE